METLFLILISDQEPGWELPELKYLYYILALSGMRVGHVEHLSRLM
ncbi:hypothetical protein MmTuc01_3325 [Methanosarcina mazei Tuc01]|uniref:Uncharacterized protein n=1 Tax=Methanosarcina mazei Tuc01 TaxID=1236903 RepID=M1QNH7_METMZ|nr:hypothetical protein MmTuc01_3325 [Methanosarcina mazei Tuc01]